MDIQTCVVYGGLLFLSVVLAKKAQNENRRDYLLMAAVAMALIAGFRATSVGLDTAQYTEQFRLIKLGRFDLVYALEKSFMYFCAVLLILFRSAHILFFIFALITHGLVMLRLWDFQNKINLPWSVACYYVMFFPESLNVMRQMLAIAIVFYGTRFIHEKEYKKFLICICIAFCFHNSALLGLGFLVMDIVRLWKSLEKEKRLKLWKNIEIVVAVAAAVVLILILKFNLIARYQKYFTRVQINFGMMLPAKFLFLLGTIYLMHDGLKKYKRTDEGREYIRGIQSVRFYYGLGILITSLGYFLREANRMGWYFSIVECIYFGLIAKKGKYCKLFRVGVLLILAYTFVHKLMNGSNGEIPYLFFLQV